MINCVIILSGGVGSRLWPLSTEDKPKQFLQMFNDKSLLENTIDRFDKNFHKIIVTNIKYESYFKECEHDVIYEPSSQNTYPAILIAIKHAYKKYGNNINFIIAPSDHYMDDIQFKNYINNVFSQTIDNITTFGIVPTYPETQYGYIEYNENTLHKFIEKPDKDTATKLVESDKYLWNSGMFIFTYNIIYDTINKLYQRPNIFDKMEDIYTKSEKVKNHIYLNEQYSELENISFDYAVMEHINNGYVIKYEGLWNDIGLFNRLLEINNKDENNNITNGCAHIHNTNNSYINVDNGNVCIIGQTDSIIIKKNNNLLISSLNESHNIKKLLKKIKEQDNYRPWGYYDILYSSEKYQVKRISVNPKQKLSLQYHHHRSEHWTIVKGTATVTVGNDIHTLHENQSVYIPKLVNHRMENNTDDEIIFIEVQVGDYIAEDDIVRLNDIYNRT
jgi:mannose-1-phosphate guanylyltransferase/mannose-6-phosphate isomerase